MTSLRDLLRPYSLAPGDKLVRLGREMDGGYLVPKSVLKEGCNLFSFGIGQDFSFETDYEAKSDGAVFMFDHTVDLELKEPFLHFEKKKCTLEFLDDLMDRNMDTCLKMDIEGDEYECLNLNRWEFLPVAMVVEFHDIDQRGGVLGWVLAHLWLNGFRIVHVHGNNHGGLAFKDDGFQVPVTIEITFVNHAVIPVGEPFYGKLPLPGLDFPNNPDAPDYELDFSK